MGPRASRPHLRKKERARRPRSQDGPTRLSSAPSPQSDLTECPADPRAIILQRLVTLAFHHLVSVLVPSAVGEVMPEHGGGGLGFPNDPERHVTLRHAHHAFLPIPPRPAAPH